MTPGVDPWMWVALLLALSMSGVTMAVAVGWLFARVRKLERAVDAAHHEVQYNNAASVKDAVERVEIDTARLRDRFEGRATIGGAR